MARLGRSEVWPAGLQERLTPACPSQRLRQHRRGGSRAGRGQAGGTHRLDRRRRAPGGWPARSAATAGAGRWRASTAAGAGDPRHCRGQSWIRHATWPCARAPSPSWSAGITTLKDSAEALAVKMADSDLRIAAAVPDMTSPAPLGPWRVSPRSARWHPAALALAAGFACAARLLRQVHEVPRPRTSRPWPSCSWLTARKCRPKPQREITRHRPARSAGTDRQQHLPCLRHPRRGRPDAGCRRGRADRPGHRLADARTGPGRHRGGPRWPPVRPGTQSRG